MAHSASLVLVLVTRKLSQSLLCLCIFVLRQHIGKLLTNVVQVRREPPEYLLTVLAAMALHARGQHLGHVVACTASVELRRHIVGLVVKLLLVLVLEKRVGNSEIVT